MTDLNTEIERQAILQEVLKFLGTPKTTDDIAQEFGWHVQTAREKVWTLRDMGKVKPIVRRDKRRKMWQASGGAGSQGVVNLMTSQYTTPLTSFFAHSGGQRKALGDVIAEGLSYLWCRAYYRAQDQSDVRNVAMQGTMDPLLEVRRALEKAYLIHVHYVEALEKMLVDLPELWNDSAAILRMAGDLDRGTVERNAEHFEEWARTVLEQ